jgi:sulfite exporter TauE/SafE
VRKGRQTGKRNRLAHSGEGALAALRPTFLYNTGRVISYTAIGFIVGALGSAITFGNAMQGGLKLLAGVFMVVMGMGMLGIFPWFRRFAPRMPRIFARKIDAKKSESKSPLIIGLLNGLMPCGPLQAMQIYALSTGNPFAGALSMFLFSVGTVPLMFGLGVLGTILSKKFTRKIMTVGAVLVVVLGLSIFSQGWSLSGITLPNLLPQETAMQPAQTGGSDTGAQIENGTQIVKSTLSRGAYPNITVQTGIPVKWVIDAPQGSVNGCNNRMIINEYGIEHSFSPGENVIEFTPTKTGTIRYSCWMGMIHGTINVVDAGTAPAAADDAGASGEDGGASCHN